MPKVRVLAVARGEEPADLVLRGGQLVNVASGEVHATDVAIVDGVIAGLGDYDAKEVVELDGAFVAPAFVEGHMHVEGTLLAPHELARAVSARGTGTIVADPHEIANVMGPAGIAWMLEAGADAPAEILYSAPSCVPATTMETSGARLGQAEIARLLERPDVVALAELMDFPGALGGDPAVLARVQAAAGFPIDGHAPGLSGHALSAYVAAGPGSEHEATGLEEAREKLRLGMRVMLREGTPARNLRALLPLVTPATERRLMMVTDDLGPADLMDLGHLDHHLRLAVAAGVDPVSAIRMVTLNAAEWFRLHDRGLIAPGKRADVTILEDLTDFGVRATYHRGRLVAGDGESRVAFRAPPPAPATVRVDWSRVDLRVEARGDRVRVIGVIPDQIVTESLVENAVVADGEAIAGGGLAKLAVVERHTGESGCAVGFVRGLGLERGAIGSSVAHDHHNVMLAGVDDADMLLAGEELSRLGGGFVAVRDGQVLAAVALPVAGLMSPEPVERVRPCVDAVIAAARALRCVPADPFMTLSFLGLGVIPALKLTDKGLVDVAAFALTDVFV